MFKIALTAGHYLYTSAKRCMKDLDPNETREWWLNDRIADKVEAALQNYTGWDLVRTDDTTGKSEVSLAARISAAEKFDADFYLSIHHNAGIYGGTGGGIVAYVYTYASAESMAWQNALYEALIEETGLKGNRSTPKAKANLYECRETTMPAVLLELGFMDSKTDVPVILSEDYADKCAAAIVRVLVERGKLTKKPVPVAQPSASGKTMYRVCKCWSNKYSERGQIWAGYDLETAKKLCTGEYEVYDENGKVVYYPSQGDATIKLDAARSFSNTVAGTYVVTAKTGLRLRAGAGTTKKIIETMPSGSKFTCYGYHTGEWLYGIAESGKKGYCAKSYLVKK